MEKQIQEKNEEFYKENVKQYFCGDQLATDVWWHKYRAKNEIHPVQMFNRICDELTHYGVKWFENANTEIENICKLSDYGKILYSHFTTYDKLLPEMLSKFMHSNIDGFKRVILGGSMNSGIGVDDYSSLSNCLVLGKPEDSYAGILWKDHELVECMKRRCGVGIALDNIRPSGSVVNNQSKISSGVVQFMERFSNTTRECSQNGRRESVLRVC